MMISYTTRVDLGIATHQTNKGHILKSPLLPFFGKREDNSMPNAIPLKTLFAGFSPMSQGVHATAEGIVRLKEAQATQKDDEGRPLTYERISEKSGVSDKTVKRFFKGENVRLTSVFAIIDVLGLKREDVLPPEDSFVSKAIGDIEEKRTENPERAHELVEALEKELLNLKRQEQVSSIARDWLKGNRKTLSRDAAHSALSTFYSKKLLNTDAIKIEEIDQLAVEIKIYLKYIYEWIDIGDWKFIDAAMQSAPPPVTREPEIYVEALTFIKEQRVSRDLSSEEAVEISNCLDYFIKTIPLRGGM